MERERTTSFSSVSMNICQAPAVCQTALEATEELILSHTPESSDSKAKQVIKYFFICSKSKSHNKRKPGGG